MRDLQKRGVINLSEVRRPEPDNSKLNLIATWHPTFAYFHSPFEWGAFDADISRFARMVRNELEPLPLAKDLKINPTLNDVRELHRWALKHKLPVSLDIETMPERSGDEWRHTGKDPLRAKLQLLGMGNGTSAFSHYWTDGTRQVEKAIKALLLDARVVKILQNGDWFDLRVMARYGLYVRNIVDTREQRRALVATSPLRLDYIGSLTTDYFAWKEDHQSKDEKGFVFTQDINKKKLYNCHDCVVTWRSYIHMTKEPVWKTPRVQRLYAHQRKLAQIAASMHTTGIRIDKMQRYFMAWGLKQEHQERAEAVSKAVNISGFVPSPDNMRSLIFKKHAVGKKAKFARFNLEDPFDPEMYVKPKEMETISVGENALTLLLIDPETPAELKEIIKLYWECQAVWKKRSTYVVSKGVSQTIDGKYRMHADWNSCGTDTGRFSSALMVIPKELRSMYIADPGCVIVGADIRQQELRVMYAITGDEALGDGIRKGNVYVEEAKDYFDLPAHFTKKPDGVPYDPTKHIKPEAYKITKNTRLAAQYGSGKKKFFQQLIGNDRSVQYDAAMRVRDKFLDRNKRTVQWWEEETERVYATSYSESRIMHRRRVYPRPPERPDIANYPIQSTAADGKNLALIAVFDTIQKYKMKSRIIIDLHDAIYINTPYAEVKAMTEILQTCMETAYRSLTTTVPFPVDIEAHERWSDFG